MGGNICIFSRLISSYRTKYTAFSFHSSVLNSSTGLVIIENENGGGGGGGQNDYLLFSNNS